METLEFEGDGSSFDLTSISSANPTANGSRLTVPADGGVSHVLNGADAEGGVTFGLVSGPENGTLTLNADGSYDFQANAGFTGSDSFTYFVRDADGLGQTATVDISVGEAAPDVQSVGLTAAAGEHFTYQAASGGDRFVWSVSSWVNIDALGNGNTIFSAGTSIEHVDFAITSNGFLRAGYNSSINGPLWNLSSTAAENQLSIGQWHHVVLSVDTASRLVRLYLDGREIASTVSNQFVTTGPVNEPGTDHYIGSDLGTPFFNGQMADFHFVDGDLLAPEEMGYTDEFGAWRPSLYEGGHGETGYHLDFTDGSGLGIDSSGNNNDVTAVNLDAADQGFVTGLPIDSYHGTSSDDALVGDAGDNRIAGNAGNDLVAGGEGNDVYEFGYSGGQDIIDNDASDAAVADDGVLFGTGVEADDVWFRQEGDDLVAQLLNSNDQVTLADWYTNVDARVDHFDLADGQTLSATNVETLVQAMSSFSPQSVADGTVDQNQDFDNVQSTIAVSWTAGS